MGFFLLLLLGLMILSLLPPTKPPNNDNKLVVKKKKKCPPHAWFWQDIVDQNGVKQGERLVCKDCGPLKAHYDGGE